MTLSGSDATQLDRGHAAKKNWHCSWACGLWSLFWREEGGARMGIERGSA